MGASIDLTADNGSDMANIVRTSAESADLMS